MTRLQQWLARRYPAPFRAEFGREILAQLADEAAAARKLGTLATLRWRVAATLDLAMSVVAEHVRPTWHAPFQDPPPGSPSMLSEWLHDLRYATRALRRTPGFTLIAAGTLGLAIGANAGIFSVIKTVLLTPLPYQHLDRLVSLSSSAPGTEMPETFGVSDELYVQLEHATKVDAIAAYNGPFTSTMRSDERVERLRMASSTWNLFPMLGAHPILGRLPDASDEDRVVLLSYALWQTWFGADPKVLGRTFYVAGKSRTVIGVMDKGFGFPTDNTMLWFPQQVDRPPYSPEEFGAGVIARLKPGVTAEAAAAEFTTLGRGTPAALGGPVSFTRLMTKYRATVTPLADAMLGDVRRPLWVLLAAVTIVLLIACANVANLFVVRGEGRLRELAVRRALGAGAGILIRLQMAETLVVALGAGVIAVVLARLMLPVFMAVAPEDIPRLRAVHLDLVTLGYTLLMAIAAAVACGTGPAIRGARAELQRLRGGGRGNTGARGRVRNVLVMAQTALALVMLIGSGLLVRSFLALSHVKPGYDTHDVFTFQIAPQRPTLHDGPTYAQFQMEFMDRLRALPGVKSVGEVDNVPLDEGTETGRFVTEGASAGNGGTLLHFTLTAGDYFPTMGIKVLRGHAFTNAEATSPDHIVVSRTAAELLWPKQDPIGQRLQFVNDTAWHTVVGEVDDVRQDSYRLPPEALIYIPLVGPTPESWDAGSPAVVVKTARAETIAPEVRALVHEMVPEAPMYRVFTMAALEKRMMAPLSFLMLTLGLAAGLSLLLGAVGLYGVLSYVVTQRTREIGVRLALGADTGMVRRMVVAEGSRVVGAGVLLGLVVAFVSTRALASSLYGVNAFDGVTFAAMSVLLLAVGALASYVPARRASSVDPMESLRGE